jgi:hypothetical protein
MAGEAGRKRATYEDVLRAPENMIAVDPREKTVEGFRHDGGGYRLVGTYGGDDAVRAEPFDAIEIPPAFLWGK